MVRVTPMTCLSFISKPCASRTAPAMSRPMPTSERSDHDTMFSIDGFSDLPLEDCTGRPGEVADDDARGGEAPSCGSRWMDSGPLQALSDDGAPLIGRQARPRRPQGSVPTGEGGEGGVVRMVSQSAL